jgi:predicted O-linked N-acetylglucosamine transferase (SPINDLY family)
MPSLTVPEALALAVRLHQGGDLPQAEQLYRAILQADPNQVDALHLLGVIAYQAGHHEQAAASIGQALRLQPNAAEMHNNLGMVFQAQGKLAEAQDCYRQALRLQPGFAAAHYNLGNVLKDQGQLDEAAACYQQAVRLQPDHADAHNNLGTLLKSQGRLVEATACYRQALRLRPDSPEPHNNLGNVLKDQWQLDEAAACYQQALRLNPDYAEGHYNLGNVRKEQGLLDEMLACYRQALRLQPDFAEAHGNLLYTLHFTPDYDAAAIYEEHRRWNLRYAEPLARLTQPHANDRSPDRRLRVGYVSPDFYQHPIGRFLLPLLEAHDHTRFEIFCYSSRNRADEITDRCRAHADVWRDVYGLSDEQLADAIRRDQIDVLVDLTMHMAHSRLLVFARKPAPVQVTYLAYCGTTGLRAMDYRLTDPYLDPPGRDESHYSERSVRLPETYWCYRPTIPMPAVGPLPALQAGHVTFGCLNNFCKVTAPTLAAWGRLLQELPQARLLLHAHAGSHRDRVRDFFSGLGVAPDRLSFVGQVPMAEYVRTYERLDVALDPFPYGGGTTTCDALWMGVPVVSLAGPTAVGRSGLSILSNVGLAELVAYDTGQYVQRAVELARDFPRLRELRAGMRERMQHSPLMDAPRFARNVEAAFRSMWA